MRLFKTLLTFSIIGGVIFISLGDKFLPKPLNTYSAITRNTINKKLLGFMPDPKLKKPSADREKQAEDFLQK